MSDILTGKQLLAVDALMGGHNIAGAAKAAGVSVRTLRRWRDLPHFHAELQARAGESLEDTTRRLSATMAGAPAVIYAIMTDNASPAGVRLAAAKAALENGARFIELFSINERLEALEAKYENS